MSIIPYLISVSIHILLAVIWLGGIFLLFFIGPLIRKKDIDLSKKVNGVFKKITWTVILIFPISGFLNIYLKTNITTVLELLKNSKNLQLKIFIYFTILILKYLHDFFGKRALQNPTFFTLTIILGRINFILGIIMIVLGVLISRGYY